MSNQIIKFHKCLLKVRPTPKLPKKEYLESGKFPVISQESSLISGYYNDSDMLFKVDKPVIVFGDHTQVIKYIDFSFIRGADGTKILLPIDEINTKYFYYFLMLHMPKSKGYARHFKLLKDIDINIPSLKVQEKYVAKLDKYFDNIEKAELLASKKIMHLHSLKKSILSKELKNINL